MSEPSGTPTDQRQRLSPYELRYLTAEADRVGHAIEVQIHEDPCTGHEGTDEACTCGAVSFYVYPASGSLN